MNIFSLNRKQIKAKPLSTILNIFLFATGVAIISFLFLTTDKIESQLKNNVANIDLVVGAKGSPLQLILAGIYHIDHPTGNIQYKDALELTKNPLVKQAVPLALGDSYHGFRIVGTNQTYPDLYHGQLKEGKPWKSDFEANIGSKVAEKTGLRIGDHFAGVHGFIEEAGHAHDEHEYAVTGIFEETGTVLDQLILTNIESVWKIHEHHHDEHSDPGIGAEEDHDHHHGQADDHSHEHEVGHDHETAEAHAQISGNDEEKEITLLLVKYTNPMGAITLPRLVNSTTNMQAASPALEINRLYSLMGVGVHTIRLIAGFIIIISAFSIFISLLNSLKERKYELALIRSMGGSRNKLFSLIVLEGVTIAFIGYLAGLVLSRLGMLFISYYAETNYHYSLQQWFNLNDVYFLFVSLIIGLLSALIPAIKAMRTDISKTLSE
ncbi:MAG: ABC transporter permease [Proteiniphilum sp.]|jgi:putative ABC transport system permease protein|uniref:ABC transporter permease n=1 Tax=Proteiniphilum sp. TaxID=1926877 RepID=UPI002B1F7D4E|nr:ABC transporter permease [Proteiniphilum sp.]MEA5062114.1 ABC transporter permease [Petrimonas sp.]MEA5128969.1 ABC transporter permease [Proteiniphilum sp.]